MITAKDRELLGVSNRSDAMGVLAVWAIVGDPPEALPPTAMPQLEEEVEELAESGTVHVLYTPPAHAAGPLPEQVRKGVH